jgi:hypothetical protein
MLQNKQVPIMHLPEMLLKQKARKLVLQEMPKMPRLLLRKLLLMPN